MKRCKVVVLLITLLLLSSFVFAGGKKEDESTKAKPEEKQKTETAVADETVIVVGAQEDQTNLDQLKDNQGHNPMVKQLMYNGLAEYNQDGKLIPGLAKRWEISDDLTEYTFYLRKGVKFHNGREFTADDVKKTIEWAVDEDNACIYGAQYQVITNIEIIDDYTIKFTLNAPNSVFLHDVASGKRPIIAIEQYDNNGNVIEPIGTGPYKFIEWQKGSRLVLEKFDDYWGGEVNVDKFIFKPISDFTVKYSALKNGEIDLADYMASEDVIQYKNNPSDDYVLAVSDKAISEVMALTYNVTREPFTNEKVRQAIAYAIDKDAVNAAVMNGLGAETNSFYPTGFWASDEIFEYPYDPAKAKQLLAEAGYPNGFETTIDAQGGHQKFINTAVIVQQYLKDVGIEAELYVPEVALWLDNEAKANFDLHIAGTIVLADPNVLNALFLEKDCVYPGWFGMFYDPEIDKIIKETRKIADLQKRKEMQVELFSILNKKAGVRWLYTEMQSYGYRSNIEGVEYDVQSNFIWGLNKGWPQIRKK